LLEREQDLVKVRSGITGACKGAVAMPDLAALDGVHALYGKMESCRSFLL